MNAQLADSYRHCKRISRRAASSFYWSFSLLPREQRDAMYAIYAFSRHTDDLGDCLAATDVRRANLEAWRESLAHALRGTFDDPSWPAVVDTIQRFSIPPDCLYEVIDGVAMDLVPPDYESFQDLRRYCYRVASAVGLACIHIWGFNDERSLQLAQTCGVAFQMTNILRDLREDAVRGRVYLPREELTHFGYSVRDIEEGTIDARLRAMMQFQIDRTERLYQEVTPLASMIAPRSRYAFLAMFATYRALLAEIKRRDGDVFSRPVRLSYGKRLRIIGSALLLPSLLLPADTLVMRESAPTSQHPLRQTGS